MELLLLVLPLAELLLPFGLADFDFVSGTGFNHTFDTALIRCDHSTFARHLKNCLKEKPLKQQGNKHTKAI